jgi:tetratricopeptide (TPR) repeat protein
VPPTPPALPISKHSLSHEHIEDIAELSQLYLAQAAETAEFSEEDLLCNLLLLYELSLEQNSQMSRKHAKKVERLAMAAFSDFGMPPPRASAPPQRRNFISKISQIFVRRERLGTETNVQSLSAISIGERRLRIEFEDKLLVSCVFKANNLPGNPPTLESALEEYSGLVERIAGILRDMEIQPDLGKGGFSKEMQERFICEIWGIMSGNLNITYGTNKHGMLWESLLTKNYDCDNSSFLVFDVAAKLGLPLRLISVPGHTVVRTEHLFFETTNGKFFNLNELEARYPNRYGESSIYDLSCADSISYYNRGNAKSDRGDFKGAIADYNKAIRLNPNLADAYYNLGIAKSDRGDIEGAKAAYLKSAELCEQQGRPEDAKKARERAARL